MFGYETVAIIGMAVGIFFGGFAKGVSGVALPITALAIALNFVDARTGLALVALPVLLTNTWQALGAGVTQIVMELRRFRVLCVLFVAGLYIGSLLVNALDPQILFAVIGVSMLIFAGSQLWKPRATPLTARQERVIGPFAGAIGGVMGGMTSIWGPPIMMFLFLLRLDKDTWIRSVAALYLLGSVPLVAFYFANGILEGERLWISIIACVPVMVGIMVGEWLRKRIDEERFRKILLILLIIMALNMVRRAII